MSAGLRQAVGFLTPLGGATTPSPAALRWFPLVGLGMGLALGGVWWVGGRVWAPALAAAVVVSADLALTGLLHLDGLVDSADGLLPQLSPERRLDVMDQPQAGAFGVGVTVAVLLVRWAALATILPSPLLLAALWCLSRTAMAVAALRLRYARTDGGLASAFRPEHPPKASAGLAAGAAGLVLAAGAAALWDPVGGPVAVAAAGAGAGAVLLVAHRRIGGFTGDVLGAAGVVGETCGLVAAAGSW